MLELSRVVSSVANVTIYQSLERLIFMNSSKLKRGLLLFAFGALVFTQSFQLQAQDDGGLGGQIADGAFGDGGGGGAAGNIDGAADLDLGGSGEDNRNQGFIGATADRVTENTFVGSTSQTFGALAEDGTFGGGVNAGTISTIPGGGGGGGGGGNVGGGQGGAGGITGTDSGSIFRSNLRTRLRPAFAAPVIPAQVTETNFYNNLARQPSAQSLVGRYQVSVQNGAVTVTGVVDSQADADRLIRQLRLQPGIYGRIDNQLQVIR